MGQVTEGITVAAALFALAAQQAVERAGQAQQFPGMLFAQALASAGLDLVELQAHLSQRSQPPGQPCPQQQHQREQRCTEAQVEFFAQPGQRQLVFTHRLQSDDAIGRALATEQFHFHVIDEKLFTVVLTDAGKLIATAIVAWDVIDVFFGGGPRTPHQRAIPVIDITEQAPVRQVELLIRQHRRHLQLVVLDTRSRYQRGDVRSQALFDRLLQRQAERPLQRR
ncbi:hypothetical protein D3C80_1428870 [compost metagenome]